MRFAEAQAEFHNTPTVEAARAYHRLAWRAYVDGDLGDDEFNAIMLEVEEWLAKRALH